MSCSLVIGSFAPRILARRSTWFLGPGQAEEVGEVASERLDLRWRQEIRSHQLQGVLESV